MTLASPSARIALRLLLLCLLDIGGGSAQGGEFAWRCSHEKPELFWEADPPEGAELDAKRAPWLHVLDVRNTLALLARRASFVRMPSAEEEGGLPAPLQERLRGALRHLGGAPEASGVCIGVPDVFSKGWAQHFHAEAPIRGEAEAAGIAARAAEVLPEGRYCHGLALDARHWSGLRVSRFEIQEFIAREVAAERDVLVVRGSARGPSDDVLRPVLRMARMSAVLPALDDPAAALDFVAQLERILSEDLAASPDPLLLLTGLPAALSALLAAELACRRPSAQVLDVGEFRMVGNGLRLARSPLLTSETLLLGGAAVVGTGVASVSGIEGPRPQLRRGGIGGSSAFHRGDADGGAGIGSSAAAPWVELDGPWQVEITFDGGAPTTEGLAAGSIIVPFPPQSPLGLTLKVSPYEVVWYRRLLQLPASWCGEGLPGSGPRALLHIDACDWECTIFLDGRPLLKHEGGYDPFVVEIGRAADFCSPGTAELLVRAWDPTDVGCEFTDKPPVPCVECCQSAWQPRGKQSLNPGFIMYTGVTGLWRQAPWLEVVPPCHVARVAVRVLGPLEVEVRVSSTCSGRQVRVHVLPRAPPPREAGDIGQLGAAEGVCCGTPLVVVLRSPLFEWSPDSPTLYEAHVLLGDDTRDEVVQHFARRSITLVEGRLRLNGQPIFMNGVLYQGYWPESLLTPPSNGALERDLQAIKLAGFNTVRVHAVVMGARFYMLCDVLGLLVWQDMPSGDGRVLPVWEKRRHDADQARSQTGTDTDANEITRTAESRQAFRTELQAMIQWLMPFASIVVWVIFNEGWGQSETLATTEFVRELDPTRLVDAVSGWNEAAGRGASPLGDFVDIHNYEGRPWGDLPETFQNWPFEVRGRAKVLGEYGGLGYAREGHEWAADMSWGYGKVSQTAGKFREALQALVGRLTRLMCEEGLSAAIYTQWTDVETEINGLLTYDRVPKLPLDVLREEVGLKVMEAFDRCLGR